MHRFSRPAVAASLLALALAAGPTAPAAAQVQIPEASRRCALYETAFRAVEAQLASREGPGRADRRFAHETFGRPSPAALAGRRMEPATDLRACPDLQQLVAAAGVRIVDRPPFGVRGMTAPPYEHFSRPVRADGKTHLTYYVEEDVEWVDLVLTQDPDGQWRAEDARRTRLEPAAAPPRPACNRSREGC